MINDKLLVITGIDGAGKTTQSISLFYFFKGKGVRVKLIHYEMNPVFNKLLYLVTCIRRIFATHIKLSTRAASGDVNVKGCSWNIIRKLAIFLIYVLDTMLFYKLKLKCSLNRNNLIVLDRFPLIDGISFLWLHGVSPSLTWRIFQRYFDFPSVIIFLDIPSEIAWFRRKELTLRRLKVHYIQLKAIISLIIRNDPRVRLITVAGSKTRDEVHREIVDQLHSFWKAPS